MGDLVETLTRGNVTEVKVILASVVLALAVYQLVLIAVGYGKVRPPFLASRAASLAHRASGDVIAILMVVVAIMCISYFGARGRRRASTSWRRPPCWSCSRSRSSSCAAGTGSGRLLPLLGTCVFVLLVVTWATSAGDLLADR